jgi:hypothetical protein
VVKIDVYNMQGQRIQLLTNQTFTAGFHTVKFDGQNLASGLYIVTAKIKSTETSKSYNFDQKILLMK